MSEQEIAVTLTSNESATPLTWSTNQRLGATARRFALEDQATSVLGEDPETVKIITGFGPTNAPTAGTLSVMFGIRELQTRLDSPMTVVVSDLGAWNSRNLPWGELVRYRDKIIAFMGRLGIQGTGTEVRTHLDPANLIRAGRIGRFLTAADLGKYSESLNELYRSHGLLGSEIGVMLDTLFTVADILEPADQGYQNILMVSGFEEGYFAELARIVVSRQATSGDLSLDWGQVSIGALFFRVLPGFGGYPKMSKSIPRSAINLSMTEDEIRDRILSDEPGDQDAIMESISLASDWSDDAITNAMTARQTPSGRDWLRIREDYLEYFMELQSIWHDS